MGLLLVCFESVMARVGTARSTNSAADRGRMLQDRCVRWSPMCATVRMKIEVGRVSGLYWEVGSPQPAERVAASMNGGEAPHAGLFSRYFHAS